MVVESRPIDVLHHQQPIVVVSMPTPQRGVKRSAASTADEQDAITWASSKAPRRDSATASHSNTPLSRQRTSVRSPRARFASESDEVHILEEEDDDGTEKMPEQPQETAVKVTTRERSHGRLED
jgi:hypothetical protein